MNVSSKHWKPLRFMPCPLYLLRISRHLLIWMDRASFDSPDWWEILHYWHSKRPLS